jgi:hypothetical protein
VGILAAHINDAALVVVDESGIRYREPGYALLDDQQLTTGKVAFAEARIHPRRIQNTYWSKLDTTPIPDRRFQHLSAADLASRQLEQIWQAAGRGGDQFVVAVPAYMGKENLGLFLGIAAELGIPVTALVDAAVAATRRQYVGAVPVHVDLSLHSTTLTRIAQSGQAQVDRAELIEGNGLLALYDAWISVIAEAFVRQSRFDPLHTAETEQTLLERLPEWLVAASAGDTIALDIEYRGIAHHAELDSLELVAAAAPIYHSIVSSLRALYRADETPALQLTDRAGRMPGLADMLKARVGGEVFLLESGATARGLLSRCAGMQMGDHSVSLLRHLPWDRAAVEVAAEDAAAHSGQPTHLLFENTAYPIGADPLTLGSQAADAERWVDLREDMPGVSRRHCSLQQENGQCIVRDYSRYGTFLNGHRIDGSAVLQIGDRIRLGTPGFELRLIRTEQGSGS